MSAPWNMLPGATELNPRADLLQSGKIVSIRVDATSYADARRRIVAWSHQSESRYVCVATVNNVMRAHEEPEFQRIMHAADLVTPDGMPLVWGLRLRGIRSATRVYGPDLTPVLLAAAEEAGFPVAFYGGSPETLARLLNTARRRYRGLAISYANSPPFRPATQKELADAAAAINASGARMVFVGLSTPKQERWMAAQKGQIQAPMIGVGAAFDFLAGVKPQAPHWMRRIGMEWSFRLLSEPRRLAGRYLKDNPRFLVLFARQLLSAAVSREQLSFGDE